MSPRTASIGLGPGMSPREGAVDAIFRFCQALDDNNEELLRSAFLQDGTVDLSGLATCTGKSYTDQTGIENIVNGVFAHVGPIDSFHHLGNLRVKLNDAQNQAEITVYSVAQHFKKGEGNDPSNRNSLLMGNRYWAEVVKPDDASDGLWRIRRIEVSNHSCEGDLAVLD